MTIRATFAWVVALGCIGGLSGLACGGADPASSTGGDATVADIPAELVPAAAPRLYRLTHDQWENTVQDLFRLPEPTGHSALFRDDARTGGSLFDTDVASLEIDDALWIGYRVAAGRVAETVTTDPDLLAAVLASGDAAVRAGAGPAEGFVRGFARRAYRRPPSEVEVAELLDQFHAAPDLYAQAGLDPFVAGVRHVIESVLQSPLFLFRIEAREGSAEEHAAGVIRLDDHELAQRLSYFLWDSMPDDALFAAADIGALGNPQRRAAEVARMVEHPRAAAVVVKFHSQLLDVARMADIRPDPATFPDIPDDLGVAAAGEHERFVRDVVFGADGGLVELLTASDTILGPGDAALAAIYGVAAPDDGDTWVALDPAQRRGVLSRVGFLATHASSVEPSPVLRGAFVAERLACLEFGPRPDDAPTLPPGDEGQTNRERVVAHTEQVGSSCAGCHTTLINPFGFAFEHHDATGAYRTLDNGAPVDAAATVRLGDEAVTVDGAAELATAMAESSAVHGCYARHWIEFAHGRATEAADEGVVEELADASRGGASIRELLFAVATSPAFGVRAADIDAEGGAP